MLRIAKADLESLKRRHKHGDFKLELEGVLVNSSIPAAERRVAHYSTPGCGRYTG
jgi:hypothetical protein